MVCTGHTHGNWPVLASLVRVVWWDVYLEADKTFYHSLHQQDHGALVEGRYQNVERHFMLLFTDTCNPE